MWIFFDTSNPDLTFGLVEGKEYKVGRVNSHISIGKDISISRNHAVISVTAENKVIVKDDKSSFGTYVGEAAIKSSGQSSQDDRVRKGQAVEMTDGTRVRFGLHSTIFKLMWQEPLKVCPSTLSSGDKKTLVSDLNYMDVGILRSTWTPDITHLAVKEAILTVKVANALAAGIPLVTPTFFSDYVTCLRSQQRLPDPKNYIPKLKETSFNPNEVNLGVDQSRRKLFKGKMFGFGSEDQMKKFELAIGYAGGKSMLVTRERPDPDIFRLPVNVLVENPDNNSPHWKRCVKIVSGSNFVQIPDMNIGKAIMTCKVDSFCNPSRPPKLLKTQHDTMSSHEILAPETQSLTAKSRPPYTSTQKDEVPETPSKNQDLPDTMETVGPLLTVKTPDEEGFLKPTPFKETDIIGKTISPKKPEVESDLKPEIPDPDDDLFQFEEEEEENGKNPGKRSLESAGFSASKRPKTQSPLWGMKRAFSAADEETEGPSKKVKNSPKKTPKKTTTTITEFSGFISKLSTSSATVVETKVEEKSAIFKKEEVSLDDLTRSYATLKVCPLLFSPKKTGKTQPRIDRQPGFVNAKKFKKQALSCPDSIVNTTIKVRVSNEETAAKEAENSRNFGNFLKPLEPPTGAFNSKKTLPEDDLWGFTNSQQF